MKLTKKDFIVFATLIANIKRDYQDRKSYGENEKIVAELILKRLENDLTQIFKNYNPKFDENTFKDYIFKILK